MANEALHISFDNGFGTLGNVYNVGSPQNGEIVLTGNSGVMEWASGPSSGHGYGTYTVEAKLEGTEPGAGIIFWPGDNKWPGQELDLAEIAQDGSGRIYGTVHWNANGNDSYSYELYDGIYTGGFHDFTMIWEAGDQLARSVGNIHLPGDQRIVDRVAGELVGAGAAIGLAAGERNVGHRDAIADDLLLGRGRRSKTRRQRKRAGAGQKGTARKTGLADHEGSG